MHVLEYIAQQADKNPSSEDPVHRRLLDAVTHNLHQLGITNPNKPIKKLH